jgi:4-hydroxy-2-oxoheptanedioate aldolase
MYHAVGAIASSGVSPMVRIPASEPWMFKRVLDAGAHAVMVCRSLLIPGYQTISIY